MMSRETFSAKLRSMHKSLVVWFNVVGGVLYIYIDAFIPEAINALPALKDHLPTSVANHIAVVLIVGNILLRTFRTSTAVEKKS
jgi:hypothetical protein